MATTMIKLRPWRTVAQRAYVPKPLDPGQRVTWERKTGPGERETCSGVVWSAGPVPSSLWVQPDGMPGEVVAVKVTRGKPGYQLPRYPAGWARDAVRRAENVRRHGHLYATVEQVTESWSWSWSCGRSTSYRTLCWHADPACADAAGRERDTDAGIRPWREVVAILTGERTPATDPRFCRRCVYLEEPAATEHVHAA